MKKKSNKWLKILAIVLIIVVILVIIVNVVINIVSNNIDDIKETEIDYYFNGYVVEEKNMTSYVKGTGEITSFNIQTIDFPANGKIKEAYVHDGDIVTAKQKLFSVIDNGELSVIYSPISGIYFETELEGTKGYQIYNLEDIGVELYASETDVASVQIGQKAIVKITALNKELEGTISYISKLPSDGKFKVKVKIPYTEDIKFGYGASIRIIIAEKENVKVIPYGALQIDNDDKYYVIKEEYKEEFYRSMMQDTNLPDEAKTYVDIGIITNNEVEIVSGLEVGDAIVEWIW